MKRVDLYGLVHKAQRFRLFGFARELGRADLDDGPSRLAVAEELRGIHHMLADHAASEERYIHPLYVALGTGAASLDDQHHELDGLLQRCVEILNEDDWSHLYARATHLIGTYLLHLDAEERMQETVLWGHYSDAELGAVFARFKAERSAAAAESDLARFVPALALHELVPVLRGLQAAPKAVEQRALALAQQELEPERWAALQRRLAG